MMIELFLIRQRVRTRMNNSYEYSLNSPPHLAAICTEYGANADGVIDYVIEKLRSEGKKIAGMRQRTIDVPTSVGAAELQNIENGEHHRITQAHGGDSDSWEINIAAIEAAAVTLAESLSVDLDLVVINRFGKLESAGGGFCCVIQRSIELGIPVLTVVNSQWQQRWHDYGDTYAATLPANSACVLQWYYASAISSVQSESPLSKTQQEDVSTV